MSNQEQLDALLHQLIQQAIASPAGSEEHARAIESIPALAQQLPGILNRERLDKLLRPYYDDALVLTERSVRRTIDNFPKTYHLDIANAAPDAVRKKFVNWYNLILKCDCIDFYRLGKKRPKPIKLDSPVKEDREISQGDITPDPRTNTNTIEYLVQQELIRYLEDDPDRELRNCASKKHPNCNCWEILQRHLLKYPPETFAKIAREVNVPTRTITDRWYGKCLPLLKEIAQRFGYEPEE